MGRRSRIMMCFCSIPTRSSTPCIQMVAQAADDPQVLAIKQTLYRPTADSPIVAESGPGRRERQRGDGAGGAAGAVR